MTPKKKKKTLTKELLSVTNLKIIYEKMEPKEVEGDDSF